jgi:hypothetical protein
MLEQVAKGGFRIACVSALPPFAVGQSRSLCKRLRARFPELKIMLGLWKFPGGVPKAQTRVAAGCADGMATSLSEGLLQTQILTGGRPAGAVDHAKKLQENEDDSNPLRRESAV